MAYIINGVLDSGEWKLATRLNAAGTSPTGYDIYGTIDGNAFVFALQSAVNISFNTTVWLNTDHTTTTGYPIFDWLNAGADFNITFVAGSNGTAAPYLYTGASPLYTEAAAQAYSAPITDFAFSADLNTVEFRVPFSALGLSATPAITDVYADINNSVFLPQDYAQGAYKVVDPATLPPPTDAGFKVGIVYSATSAAGFFDKTAYSQLFMAAQNQAAMAGVPFDILTEDDLTNLGKIASYDTLIFPSFANVPAAKLGAIQDTLTTATQQYGVGLVAAGNFMTNDETGAALAGDSYARMKALLGVQLEGWTEANAAVHVAARDVSHAVMESYTAGETIRDYASIGTQWFTAVAPNATVLADQVIAGQAHNAVLATEVGGRNVHFATESLLADNNMLAHALDWTARDAGEPALKLHMSRQSALFASRNDLDEAMQLELVRPETGPGIYDKLLPILDQWKAAYDFVGSYYIDIGDGTNDTGTDWTYSKAYYDHLLAAGNEIGSHSMTHPEDTNLLSDTELQYQFQQSKQLIEQNLKITVLGAAIPGAPEKLPVSEKVLQYFSYLSGGNAMVGAGYPGAFGYLTPDQTKVYLAPNISSDFTLIGWKQMTATQATAAWQQEWREMTAHAELPVIVFPWHDYGITGFDDPDYNEQMFTSLIQTAYQAGSEFVTLADLAQRINAFEKSGLTFSMVDADTISATVGSTGLLGTFALDLDGGQKIKGVAGWYAYDEDSVFLPSAGGTYTIDLGATPDDVTHITALPSRAELLSATSPGGGGLDFSVRGEGKLVIDLANPNGRAVSVTGATVTSLVGDRLELSLTGLGRHDVAVRLQSSYTVATTKAAAVEGAAGADGTLVFTVTRDGATDTAETVSYVLGGTATAGSDYAATPAGSVTFEPGEISKTITVTAAADILAEGAETVLLTLTGASAGGQVGATAASGAIQDAKMVPVTAVSSTTTASTISGTAAAGSAVSVFDGATLIGTATASSTGAWSVQVARLSDTVHSLSATTNTAASPGDTTGVTLYGSTLADALTGGAANDLLLGNAGADFLDGGAGADTASYASSAAGVQVSLSRTAAQLGAGDAAGDVLRSIERLIGSAFADDLNGDGADNRIEAGGGNDLLRGFGGADTLLGGEGNDSINGGAGGDFLDGGAGTDMLSYLGGTAGVAVDLAAGTGSGGDAAGDTVAGFEGVIGSEGADVLSGDAGANHLSGGGGGDALSGRAGNDGLYGDAGDDTLDGGAGADFLDGGAGVDTASYASSAAGVQVSLSRTAAQLGAGDAAGDVLRSIERLIGSAFADDLNGDGADNRIEAGGGNDLLRGFGGADTLLGGEGNDSINGGAGGDFLDGGAGTDMLSYLGGTAGVAVDLAAGTGSGGDAAGDTVAGFEGVIGSEGADVLGGDAGANHLRGGGGGDALSGRAGNDGLYGEAGDDTLDGGAGADLLSGGGGADVFRFALSSEGTDTITDFDPAADFVQVSAAGFGGGLSAGMDLAATGRFIANTSGVANSAGTGQFVYETDVGRLWWDADGSGAGARVSIATFAGLPALTAADLIVIA